MKKELIDLIQRNRISSTEVADALGKKGVISGVNALNAGHFIVGEVKYIMGYAKSNWPIHEQVKDIGDNHVIFCDMVDCGEHAAFGDIVCKFLLLYRKNLGIVTNGLMRDNHVLRKENYPIWCSGVTPLGCYNKEVELTSSLKSRYNEVKSIYEGAIMVCDDSGCTLITKEEINDHTKSRLEFIEIQEDIWYYCIDVLKWNTYETICLKRYLDEPDLLPTNLRNKIADK